MRRRRNRRPSLFIFTDRKTAVRYCVIASPGLRSLKEQTE